MKWIDGNDISLKNISGEEICEKLATELYNYNYLEWLKAEHFIQTAVFIIDFDTEFQMEGILALFNNSNENYIPNLIKAFKTIGDNNDAFIISKIYDIYKSNKGSVLDDEIYNQIEKLEEQLYLYTDFNIWQLLFDYLDYNIQKI